jgi:phosphatidylglycerol:prolipoprotein diacylglycerol transferase
MNPVCFQIGARPIYWYGVMMALACLAGMAHWAVLGRRHGRDAAHASDLVLWIVLGGIVGARAAYVAANFGEYRDDPAALFRLDRGGLIYYGGVAGGALAVAVLARVRREPLLRLGDFVITALPLGHAFGRVGCFLNHCCFGREAGPPWGVAPFGVAELPVPLYEAAANLLLYGVLLWQWRRHEARRPGRVLALYLLAYPPVRFFLEFLRGDPRQMWGRFTAAQALSLGLFAVGAVLWIMLRNRYERVARSS